MSSKATGGQTDRYSQVWQTLELMMLTFMRKGYPSPTALGLEAGFVSIFERISERFMIPAIRDVMSMIKNELWSQTEEFYTFNTLFTRKVLDLYMRYSPIVQIEMESRIDQADLSQDEELRELRDTGELREISKITAVIPSIKLMLEQGFNLDIATRMAIVQSDFTTAAQLAKSMRLMAKNPYMVVEARNLQCLIAAMSGDVETFLQLIAEPKTEGEDVYEEGMRQAITLICSKKYVHGIRARASEGSTETSLHELTSYFQQTFTDLVYDQIKTDENMTPAEFRALAIASAEIAAGRVSMMPNVENVRIVWIR